MIEYIILTFIVLLTIPIWMPFVCLLMIFLTPVMIILSPFIPIFVIIGLIYLAPFIYQSVCNIIRFLVRIIIIQMKFIVLLSFSIWLLVKVGYIKIY